MSGGLAVSKLMVGWRQMPKSVTVMSALKLSVTASMYVRKATGRKPLLWRAIHDGRRLTNCPFPDIDMHMLKLPPSTRAGLMGRGSSSRAAHVTDLGSESENKNPASHSHNGNHSHPSNSKFLTLPTILTLGRVVAVPLLVATFYMDGCRGTASTTTIFIAAAVTDWLDGYLARRMKLKSSFGAFLDPVADKLMVAATLVLLCTRPLDVDAFRQLPWLLTVPSIAIIGREITMSAVREWAASQDSKLLEAVAVNSLGKWKTATQMTALTILLATRDWSHGGAAIVVGSGVVLLYTSAGLALWSLVVYMRKIWKVLRR